MRLRIIQGTTEDQFHSGERLLESVEGHRVEGIGGTSIVGHGLVKGFEALQIGRGFRSPIPTDFGLGRNGHEAASNGDCGREKFAGLRNDLGLAVDRILEKNGVVDLSENLDAEAATGVPKLKEPEIHVVSGSTLAEVGDDFAEGAFVSRVAEELAGTTGPRENGGDFVLGDGEGEDLGTSMVEFLDSGEGSEEAVLEVLNVGDWDSGVGGHGLRSPKVGGIPSQGDPAFPANQEEPSRGVGADDGGRWNREFLSLVEC